MLWKTARIDNLGKVQPITVWTPTAGTDYSADIWAPEIHFLDGKWYIYFAADNNGNNSTHRMYVLENEAADPTTGTWTFKGKIAPATDKWAIDGNVFTYNNVSYITWSGWQGDTDGKQDIYIAKLTNPYTIAGDRVLISSPTYDWEKNNQPVWVNEGPEGIVNSTSGQLFLTFSAAGCWTDDYCIGLLTLKKEGDPLNAADWTKTPTPIFTKNPGGGAYGPGHNGFFKSPDGTEDWLIYHANAMPNQGCGDVRSPRIQPFTWNSNGAPALGQPVSVDVLLPKPSGE